MENFQRESKARRAQEDQECRNRFEEEWQHLGHPEELKEAFFEMYRSGFIEGMLVELLYLAKQKRSPTPTRENSEAKI